MQTALALLFSYMAVHGAGFHLVWDANRVEDQVTNYQVYVRSAGNATWETNYTAGTNIQMTLFWIDAGTGTIEWPNFALPWESTSKPCVVEFAATARNHCCESDFSQSYFWTNKPSPPDGMQIDYNGVVVTAKLQGARYPEGPYTNVLDYKTWTGVMSNGFFRVVMGISNDN